jgi:hypothetical protein
VIRLDTVEQRVWAAGEYALRRAREELETGNDAGFMLMDLEAAAENLAMAAREIRKRLTGSGR